MPHSTAHWHTGFLVKKPAPARKPAAADNTGGTRQIETIVVAIIPEYRQARVRDDSGNEYALTRNTKGVDLAMLREGQRVVCTVTRNLPRVLSAAAIA